MIGKKKLSAVFAVLLLTVSFLIMIPLPTPVSAVDLPTNSEVCLSIMLWKFPNGSKQYEPLLLGYLGYLAGYGIPAGTIQWLPFSRNLNYPQNESLIGALPVLAVVIRNTTADGFNMSSWEVGCKFDPLFLGYPVTFYHRTAESLPYPPGLVIPTIFEAKWNAGAANRTVGTINTMTGTVSGYKMAINDSTSITVTSPKVLCYIIPTILGFGESVLDIATYVKINDQGTVYTPGNIINGYLKFRAHEVKISPTVWVDSGPSGAYHVGDALTVPLSIVTTEPVHTWELNMSYYGVTELGAPTTPNILCEGTANVTEGHFLLLSNKTDPHGGNTFSVQVGPGWIWANGTYTVGSQYAYSWLGAVLMVVKFKVIGYGTTILDVTTCSIKDTALAEITPQPNVDLDRGLRKNYFKFEKLISIAPIFEATASFLMTWSTPTKTIGETFIMDVNLLGTSQNVRSWKSGFSFNPAVLQCDNVTEGTYLSSQGSTTFNVGNINNTIGEVSNITCTGTVSNTGPGILYKIGFTVVGYGISTIVLTDANGDPTETRLVDNSGVTEVRNPGGLAFALGIFTFWSPITVNLEFSPTNKKESYTIGETFSVQIRINSAENMRGYQTGFHFDKDFINCTGVSFGDVFAGSLYNITTIRNDLGYVTVSQVLLDPNYAAGGVGVLATITFEVIANGHSYLDLTSSLGDPTQTVITDLNAQAIALNSLVDSPWGHSGIVWKRGNVNNDASVNVGDMLALKIKLSGQPAVAGYVYDINYDGAINVGDMLQLKIILAT